MHVVGAIARIETSCIALAKARAVTLAALAKGTCASSASQKTAGSSLHNSPFQDSTGRRKLAREQFTGIPISHPRPVPWLIVAHLLSRPDLHHSLLVPLVQKGPVLRVGRC